MNKIILLLLSTFALSSLSADSLKCEKKEYRIICTYFSSRSDDLNGTTVKFHWISPKTPKDDRVREVEIPPYYGSAYDYRFIPGRVQGYWRVKVSIVDTNKTIETSFDINESEDEFFNN